MISGNTSQAWLALICFFTLFAGGCSVGMAAHGADNPDMTVLKIGAYRQTVQREFGKPKERTSEGRSLYVYTTGESGSAGRAIGHGALDVLTLGLWEVVGTPLEATKTHDKWEIDVWYSLDDDKVLSWSEIRPR